MIRHRVNIYSLLAHICRTQDKSFSYQMRGTFLCHSDLPLPNTIGWNGIALHTSTFRRPIKLNVVQSSNHFALLRVGILRQFSFMTLVRPISVWHNVLTKHFMRKSWLQPFLNFPKLNNRLCVTHVRIIILYEFKLQNSQFQFNRTDAKRTLLITRHLVGIEDKGIRIGLYSENSLE